MLNLVVSRHCGKDTKKTKFCGCWPDSRTRVEIGNMIHCYSKQALWILSYQSIHLVSPKHQVALPGKWRIIHQQTLIGCMVFPGENGCTVTRGYINPDPGPQMAPL